MISNTIFETLQRTIYGCLLFFFFLGFDKKAQYGPNFSSTQLLWLHIVKATVIFENISIFSPVTLIINLL
jgi:hypothetical protein